MGYSARRKNVEYVLSALEDALAAEGHDTDQVAAAASDD
jgi:alanine-glyoxylate transaminase/serine-glyoxylate transaminase/serine-pyruvate transaminase